MPLFKKILNPFYTIMSVLGLYGLYGGPNQAIVDGKYP